MIDRRIGKIKVRRGTDVQRQSVVFEQGELVYTTDKKRLYIGDGSTSGGIRVSHRNYVTNASGIPSDAEYGDIIHKPIEGKTYIVGRDNNGNLILILIANTNLNYKNQVNDIINKLSQLSGCLTVTPPTPPGILTWVLQPFTVSTNVGSLATFSASAVGANDITYQWKRLDTGNIAGAIQTSYTIPSVGIPDIANYVCVANSFTLSNSITSNPAQLLVGANSILAEDGTYILSELFEFIDWEVSSISAPVITTQPISQITTALSPITFNVVAHGSAPLSYQWYKDGSIIIGATNNSYTENSPTTTANYKCRVSNLVGSVDSNLATLTVYVKPYIITQPITQSVNKGNSVTLSVVAGGTSPLSYQWNKDGHIIVGETSSIFTLASAGLSDDGNYSCTVSNIGGSIDSNSVKLTVNDAFSKDFTISADTLNFVLKDALINAGWNSVLPIVVNITVNSGVKVGSNSASLPAFKVDSFPSGSTINLINNGYIVGAGGIGGIAVDHQAGTSGEKGGDAFSIKNNINITNNGTIGGGGGGGGGGAMQGSADYDGDDFNTLIAGNGGNGAGYISGKSATALNGSLGDKGYYQLSYSQTLGITKGGDGGDLGNNGKSGTALPNSPVPAGAGGSAGNAVIGNSFVNWITKGDVRGLVK